MARQKQVSTTTKDTKPAKSAKAAKSAKPVEKKTPATLAPKKAVTKKGQSKAKKSSSSSSSSSSASSASSSESSETDERASTEGTEEDAGATLSVCDADTFTHELGGMARLEISQYKGKWRVDVRHYFVGKDGRPAPTKKGINLSVAQWNALTSCVGDAIKFAKKHNVC